MLRPVLLTFAIAWGVCASPARAAAALATPPEEFAAAVAELAESDLAARQAAVSRVGASADPRAAMVLSALLDGALYQRRSDGVIVIAERAPGGFRIADAAVGTDLGTAPRRQVRRVAVDNALRAHIRSTLASRQLNAPEAAERHAAVRALLGSGTAEPIEPERLRLVNERLSVESDPRVRSALQTVLALAELELAARRSPADRRAVDTDPTVALDAAAAILGESAEPAVRERLQALAGDSTVDAAIRATAEATLGRIEARLEAYRGIETLFFGLSMGSVLVLAAIGLAITFGVMGVINMAHGELIMLGAYTTYVVQLLMPDAIGWSIAVAIPAAFLVSGLTGMLIERGVIRFLYGRPLETLLATFGISLILQQGVRSLFSPLNRSVTTPDWMSGSIEVLPGLAFTLNRLYILAFCLVVFALILLLLKRTRLGLEIRAVAQNRAMARAMGVRSHWVDALTFGLGSGVAGVAGVALSQLTNVGPNLGQAYIVDSFLVVVFGGVGNLWGTLVAGLSLGVVNKVLEPFAGAVLAKIVVLVMVVLFIQKRPRGLFPQQGRAVEG